MCVEYRVRGGWIRMIESTVGEVHVRVCVRAQVRGEHEVVRGKNRSVNCRRIEYV